MPRSESELQQQNQELINYPRETMGVDCKRWIDLSGGDEKAGIAKDLLAMRNHGGGSIVFGLDEQAGGRLVHEGPCPYGRDHYSQDAFNGIVSKYADPPFECRVHWIDCDGCDGPHVIVRVPGDLRVPCRCKKNGPDSAGEPKAGTYYIRRPKPESAAIGAAHEWDQLLDRCLRARREELVDHLRAVLGVVGTGGLAAATSRGPRTELERWRAAALTRLKELQAERGGEVYPHGAWSLAYAVLPPPADPPSLGEFRTMLEEVAGSETGWPPWWIPTREGITPYSYQGLVECWMVETAFEDPAHSDFWHGFPGGQMFLLRGYQEDSTDRAEPGKILDFTTVPIWRLGECLLHASRLARRIADSDATVAVLVRWEGLEGRQLMSFAAPFERHLTPRPTQESAVEGYGEFPATTLTDTLPEVVQELARPLYAAFDFFDPPLSLYAEELDKMRSR